MNDTYILPSFGERKKFAALTLSEKFAAIETAEKFGGSFVETIASAWFRADAMNKQRLEYAFADFFLKYHAMAVKD